MNEPNNQDLTAFTVKTEGDLVAAKLPALRSKLKDILSLGVRHLTVDLTTTEMVDSAGVGLLISAHNSLKKVGGELKVVHASPEILNLFQTMRMHQHFSISGN